MTLPQRVLLLDNLLMWLGFFMIIPLITVHFVSGLGWAAGAIGLVLAVRQLVQQGFTVVGGMLGDRFGLKPLICLGLLVRSLGFASMAFADTIPLLMASAVFAALGGALFDAPKSAAIVLLTPPEQRPRFYALQGVTSNVGMALGPLIGTLLIPYGFQAVSFMGAACYVLSLVFSFLMLPSMKVTEKKPKGSTFQGLKMALQDRPFIQFQTIQMGFFFLWVQVNVALMLHATQHGGTSLTAWVYGVYAGFTSVLQYPIMKYASKKWSSQTLLAAGVASMALGMGLMGFTHEPLTILLCTAVFAFGNLLAAPSQQTLIAGLTPPERAGTYLGVAAFPLAIGGFLGNALGGAMFDFGKAIHFVTLPWVVFFVVGSITAVLIYQFRATQAQKEEPAASTAV
ncbi:MFS transporter [Deinococcus misasensis]|uniref:MFS transporter n=1 Tax=Deinococcus misasensis TaxID=392413 RepID=UPI00068C3237|nr:MFS transporter [Deinococcus misasensis]